MIKIEQLRYLQSTACGSLLPQINKISIKAATKSESVNHLPIEMGKPVHVEHFGRTRVLRLKYHWFDWLAVW
jgi:hypothetical protein